jgi:hypothetical protein
VSDCRTSAAAAWIAASTVASRLVSSTGSPPPRSSVFRTNDSALTDGSLLAVGTPPPDAWACVISSRAIPVPAPR